MKNRLLRKIVMLGTTGSGKTTFLKNLVGDFDGAEVARNIKLEENLEYNTFNPQNPEDFASSTTTVSMNAQPVLFLTTRTNKFQYHKMEKDKLPIPEEDIDCVYPTVIIDPAGQERFDFMSEIAVKGADAAFIFADGSNVASIERITKYVKMIQEEENKKDKHIPITVFVNKKDLESRGLYVGASHVHRWIDDDRINIDETSNFSPDSFLIPLRNVLDKLDGFPVPISQIKK